MNILNYFSDFLNWKSKNETFSIFDYLSIKLTPEQLLLASQLFFPELVIIDGCVFITESQQYKFLEQAKNTCKDETSLEKYVNCVFLECMFTCNTDNDTKRIQALAEIIKNIWEIYFKKIYPELNMVTEIYEDEFDGWCVTCYRKLTP